MDNSNDLPKSHEQRPAAQVAYEKQGSSVRRDIEKTILSCAGEGSWRLQGAPGLSWLSPVARLRGYVAMLMVLMFYWFSSNTPKILHL